MDDGEQVPHLLRAEVVDLAGHLAEDGARVDHQHLAAEALRLGAVQEPQLARYGPGVEEVGADGDHDLHVAGLHQLAAHRGFGAAGARRLRRHHETGPAVPVQVAVEVADPDVVAVADARPPVDAGQAERQARIGLDLLGVDFVHVERRIGHHVVGLAQQLVRVLVIGDRLPYVPLQAVDREVHPRQADGGGVLLQPAEGEPLGRAAALFPHRARALDEHAAGAAGGIEDGAALGIEHVGDQRDQ